MAARMGELFEAPRVDTAVALSTALVLSMVVVAVAETVVAVSSSLVSPSRCCWIAALSMHEACRYLWVPAGYAVVFVLLAAFPLRRPWNWVRLALYPIASSALAAYLYGVLTLYRPFSGYPPFVAAFVAAAVGLSGYALLWEWTEQGRIDRRWRYAASVLLLLVAGALRILNYHVYLGQYPTLHLSVLQFEQLAWWLGLAGVATALARHRPVRVVGLALLAAAAILACVGWLADGTARVKPQFVDATVLGQSRLAFLSFAETRGGRAVPDPAGEARFRQYSGLPELPGGFALEDHNVLLVASEATRFDKTSLFDSELGSTPNLLRRSQTALVFESAFSPSSGTLHSMAANFTMAYPSMIAMESWMRAWTGRIYAEEETVAESLAAAGYETFWVGYNHWMPANIRGLDQGFAEVAWVKGGDDEKITTRAIEAVERQATSGTRFFGWVFLVSPHARYKAHGYDDLPRKRDVDRYLHELRYVDDQLERIFSTLERTGLLNDTIVVYLGDHGEEFREHGGTHHKTTVYTESIHVPMVIWIPGVTPGVFEEPTSTVYLFPWLFSHARSPELQRRFSERAVEIFGPVLRATEGAVLVELQGHDRMKSSLIYPDLKINYDFISERIEVYRTPVDRLEQRDLYGVDSDATRRAERLVDAYRTVRSPRMKHVTKPKKNPRR